MKFILEEEAKKETRVRARLSTEEDISNILFIELYDEKNHCWQKVIGIDGLVGRTIRWKLQEGTFPELHRNERGYIQSYQEYLGG